MINNKGEELMKTENFMAELKELCEKYNLVISHEDCGGAFLIEKLNEEGLEWLMTAWIKV